MENKIVYSSILPGTHLYGKTQLSCNDIGYTHSIFLKLGEMPRLMVGVSIRVSVAAIKDHDQKANWEERVYLAYTSTLLFITEESQDRNSNRAGSWREELMQRLCGGAAYWLSPHGLLLWNICLTM